MERGRGMRRGSWNRGWHYSNRGPSASHSRDMYAGNMDLAWAPSQSQTQYDYDQPQQSYSQQQCYNETTCSTENFVPYYEDISPSQNRQGTKRPAFDMCDSGNSAKRFTTDPSFQYRPPSDFQLPNVAKPNEAEPPDHLVPVNKNKNWVAKALQSMQVKATKDTVLREGQEPSLVMTSRMESALGRVMKQLREARSDAMLTVIKPHLKALKQMMRERIHAALLNKPVGDVDKVMEVYRAKYPKESDIEVLERLIANRPREGKRGESQDMVLHPGQKPYWNVTNHMERALGAILNDVRAANREAMLGISKQALAAVKQAIRERIHAAMLNKTVANVKDIIKQYRALNPKETDVEVFKIGIAAAGENACPSAL